MDADKVAATSSSAGTIDREQAESTLQKLGSAIFRGRNYAGYDWDSLSLVFDFDGGESLFGYVYWANDGWAPATPGGSRRSTPLWNFAGQRR